MASVESVSTLDYVLDKFGSSINIYIFWQIFPANQTPPKKKSVVSLSSDILDMMCLFSSRFRIA